MSDFNRPIEIKIFKEFEAESIFLGSETKSEWIEYIIKYLNKREDVKIIILQKPLPKQIDAEYIESLISNQKKLEVI